LCAGCVRQSRSLDRAGGKAWVVGTAQVLAGLLVAWLFFFWFGTALLSIESSFHDGTVWTRKWLAPE
jgi:hypothetical protein